MQIRKLISVLLALMLALSLCVPAMADEGGETADPLTRGELLKALYGLIEGAETDAPDEKDDVPEKKTRGRKAAEEAGDDAD